MRVSHITCLSFYSPYSSSYSVCVSFSTFSDFIDIFQVLHCAFLTFYIFQSFLPYSRSYSVRFSFYTLFFRFSRNIPDPKVCVSHYSRFSVFLAICQVLRYAFLIIHAFQCFSPYSRSYSVCFSFSMFFSGFFFFCHIPGPTVSVSLFPRFSVLSLYSRSYVVHFSFSTFFIVSGYIPCPTVCLSHFLRFSVFSTHSRS